MSEHHLGQEILDGIKEIKAFRSGKGNLKTSVLSVFAGFMGVSIRTIQDWE